LKEVFLTEENAKWKRIAAKLGKSEGGCKKMAKEMQLST
jgi:hypothetical protein